METDVNEDHLSSFHSYTSFAPDLSVQVFHIEHKVPSENEDRSPHEMPKRSTSSDESGLEVVEEITEASVLQAEHQNLFVPSHPLSSLNNQASRESLKDSNIEKCTSENVSTHCSLIEEKENVTHDEVLYDLYKALVEGSQDTVEEIVFRYSIDINVVFAGNKKFVTCNHYGWSAIHLAVANRNVKTVEFLLREGCDTEALTRDGDTALHMAAKFGAPEIISVLLEHNIFLRDRQNNQGATALLKAIFNTQYTFRENYRRCVDLLLGAGCNPNISSSSKVTALHVAVDKGDPYLVRALISSHANVNAVCDRNTSPLMRALVAKVVNPSIVTELLVAGADISVKVNGRSALHVAVSRCDESVIDMFMKRGADPNCQDLSWKTPLWIAVEENNIKLVPILVHGGGNVNYVLHPQCISLLCEAIKNNSLPMVKLLLNLGATTYTETFMWSTPLHLAVDKQNIGIIKELLRVNCSLNTTSNAKYSLRPMSPVQMAMELGNVEIICLLLQAGCKVNASWLKEDRLSRALASKPDAVRHIQKFVSEVPSLLHLSCLSIRENLRDRLRTAIQTLTKNGVIPHKIGAYISLAHILD